MNDDEKEAIGQIKAFAEIRKIHKAGGNPPPPDYKRSPGLIYRIQRTPEEQDAYEHKLWKEAKIFSKAALGLNYSEQQKKFREDRQKIDDEKHEQWRKWQADEKTNNPQFARLKSKQEQAKRLKEKHSIPEGFDSIAKRLEPLPSNKQKNYLK